MSTQSAWDIFYSVNFSFPVVIFSVFLILSLIYWCVAVLGLVDIEVFDVDTDVDADLDASPDVGSVSGLLMRLGLNGVPLTIIISFISFFGWLLSSITVYYVMPMVPTLVLKIVVGCVVLLAALYLSVYATAFSIKPIRPLFLQANKQKEINLIGQTAVVRTGKVDELFGEAKLDDGGAGLIVKVRAYQGQTFVKGDKVVILEKDKTGNIYKVISETEYQA